MTITNFRELSIWKKGKLIVLKIYKATKDFPSSEQFGLTYQLRRASCSIPSNIAEGFNRFSNPEFIRFLRISLGSCAETETQVEICTDLNLISKHLSKERIKNLEEEQRMIKGLIKSIKEK